MQRLNILYMGLTLKMKRLFRKINLKRKPSEVEKPSNYYYPSLCIEDNKLKKTAMEVGDIFNAQVSLKLTGVRKSSSKNSYTFDVIDITFKE